MTNAVNKKCPWYENQYNLNLIRTPLIQIQIGSTNKYIFNFFPMTVWPFYFTTIFTDFLGKGC